MYKILPYFSYIIFLIFVTNCQNRRTLNENETIIVDLKQKNKISVFDIFSKIELIPIETNNEILIESVSKLIYKDELFYILDKNQRCIFVIDREGRLVRKLQKVGKGIGEYADISDFEINPFTNNIETLSQWGIINIYNLKLDFISSYKLPTKIRAVHFFSNIDSDLVAFYTLFEKKSILLYSKKSAKIIDNYFEVPESIKGSPLQGLKSPFVKFNDKTIFYQGFTNTVYEFNNSDLKKRYSWDFGKKNMEINKLPQNMEIPEFVNYILSSDFVNSFFYNAENSNFISTRFVCGKERYTVFYDKIKKKCMVVNAFNELVSPPFSAISDSEGLISIVESLNIQQLITPAILDKENELKFKQIQINDNPVIIYYHY